MSTWYETEDEDIIVDKDEVNLYVTSDDFGSIYKTLTFYQVEAIYLEMKTKRRE